MTSGQRRLRGLTLAAALTLAMALTLATGPGCRGGAGGGPAAAPAKRPASVAAPCPVEAPGPPVLPLSDPRHFVVDFWLARAPVIGGAGASRSAVLLDGEQIRVHNERIAEQRRKGWLAGRWRLRERPRPPARLEARLALQLSRLRESIAAGKRVLADGRRPLDLLAKIERAVRDSAAADELRVAWRSTPIRCYPTEKALYDEPWQLPFDLMQCSQLRYGEGVRVLRKGRRYWFVWSSYAEGWVDPAALTPALDEAAAAAYLEPARYVIVDRDRLPLFFAAERDDDFAVARLGVRLPLLEAASGGRPRVRAPRRRGLGEAWLPRGYRPQEGPQPLTRERFWRAAFSLLDTPYGWGGTGGHRDCSRMLMDLFALFGLQIPRNSWQQGQAGVRTVEVGELDESGKVAAIERAGASGLVLLYLPGHIMLYLGRDGDQLYALHQFSGYLSRCAAATGDRRETMNRVNRATVTSLELGRGSSRRAFIERITRLVVFGPPSSPRGPASRPAAD